MDVKFEGSIIGVFEDVVEVDASMGYQGAIYVNISESDKRNFWNEVVDSSYFEVGMAVVFNTTGIMALSLPPRVSAIEFKEVRDLIPLIINVESVGEVVHAIIDDETSVYNNSEVIINKDEGIHLEAGKKYAVAYNGIMTRSIPPHIYIEDFIEL